VDPNRIKVIHDPISEEFSHIPKKFNKEKPNILQLGTKENKNLIMLIRALKGISCNLQIIGTLSERQVAELKENEITYEANSELTDEEIRIKYSQCDIVSFVSTYEGFGMPIVEANAIGRVVVTSNILSMPEVGADAAHFVDPFDVESIRTGIIRVINDDHYRDKLIANGFVNRNRFDPRSIAKQYSEIYKALVDHRKMR
jgi:glycosyltransferase involved in cell wall biosynthesis